MKSSFKAEYPSVINRLYSGQQPQKAPTLGELAGIKKAESAAQKPVNSEFIGLTNFSEETSRLLETLQPASISPTPEISLKSYQPGKIPVKSMTNADVELAPPPPPAPVVLRAYRQQIPVTKVTAEDLPPAKKPVDQIIKNAARAHGIDEKLAMAVAKAESSFDINAVSKDGHESKGLFQLLDSTAKDLAPDLFVDGDYNPFDPQLNSELGNKYLSQLHELFSGNNYLMKGLSTFPAISDEDREKFAVAAFNAGQGAVARAQAKALSGGGNPGVFSDINQYLPETTQVYVERVQKFKEEQKLAPSVHYSG